jgi:integrase
VLDVLSRDEIDHLEDAARAEPDKVIVRLLADTGIRASELLGLRSSDLVERGRDRFIQVVGRSQGGGANGDKGRLVPVQPQLYRRLQRLARGRPVDAEGDWICCSRRGQGRVPEHARKRG